MEKKDMLGVRKRPAAVAAAKRRRRLVAPSKAAGGGGAGALAKAITAYLASDSYMYAPLVSAPPSPPPLPAAAVVPSTAPPVSTPGTSSPQFSMCSISLKMYCSECRANYRG
ncbi:hypothetical protein HU200_006429 [Digitaria exilis]|uniref:Uncharacterized protein n=1 Tax=Digitaria exilis TaxID=1010633 RepID=A0A835KRQ1_9POAL|nr:hypothetical protein HU200_006429 [Digitaria exilis]